MFDLSTLPVSGGVVIGGALYALVSAGAGQVVAERTIAMSGWTEDCARDIAQFFKNELITRQEQDALVPETDCGNVVGKWHPTINQLCWEFGNPDLGNLGGVDTKIARKAEQRARDLERQQLEDAARGAGSQCACAAAVYRRQNIIGLAVYAGTARLVTMPHVENMTSSLQAALLEPICANYTGGL